MHDMTATYSPEDNKLRLYPVTRLDSETYARVKAAGFRWAAKQELFVAPMWTPGREDLLLELCGEIGDEDTSLVDRAEARADRFEGYSDKRAGEAQAARKAVSALADGIPLGQPILVGHHSERHARKDAERIENGMRKAVSMWETSQYWQDRAAGALAAAKYKDLPGVRARRIKGLEAEKRKAERSKAESEKGLELWTTEGLTREQAIVVADRYGLRINCTKENPSGTSAWYALNPDQENPASVEEFQDVARRVYPRSIANYERWIAHYENRITYEKAMLEEQGESKLLEKPKRPAPLPLCNYRAPEGIDIENIYHRGEMIHYPQVEMTKAEYADIGTDHKGTRVVDNSHRVRVGYRRGGSFCVFLTDSKIHERPAPIEKTAPEPLRVAKTTYTPRPEPTEDEKAFSALKRAVKTGPVEVVAVPQLFPTPHDIAAEMTQAADIEDGHTVLEPSAGAGNILQAIECGHVTAVELNHRLAARLRENFPRATVKQADFLACNGDLGLFDRIIMNPPFENGSDIKHIKHALHMLKPGGILVALCANGPRQNDELRPLADEWTVLPPNSFKAAGTGVNVAMLTIRL